MIDFGKIDEENIKQFLLNKQDKNYSPQTINLYLNAIKIFYREVLKTPKKMISKLDKEKEENLQAEKTFAQNLRTQILEREETLDKLLDLQLSDTISTEEYTAKKQKILNQKIEISEKLKDFEQKGNHWLKLCKNFILTANQAQITALQGNFSEKKNFLKKIGSNPLLRERRVFVEYKNPWKLLENSSAEASGRSPERGGKRVLS